MGRSLLSGFAAFVIPFIVGAGTAHAQDDWQFEVTPYAWLLGVDGDVTVGERTVDVDVGFDDVWDAADFGGSVLTVTQYRRWVLWGQLDYLALDTSNLDNSPSRGKLETDALITTVAAGYQFDTFGEHGKLDLLAGVRYFGIENELTIGNFNTERSSDIVDGVIVARPSVQLLDWLRFNPTLSVGAGDSNLTYELWPQLQAQLTDLLALRVGYRRLHYDFDNRGNNFDASIQGFIVGLGFTF